MRARVSAATGPSHLWAIGSPKGWRPAQVPRALRGLRSKWECSYDIADHARAGSESPKRSAARESVQAITMAQ